MKTLVWTLPSRLVHWFLALFIVASYFSGDEAEWLGWHALAGLSAGFLLAFRVVWGVFGPLYSRFSHFAFTPAMTARLASKSSVSKESFPGHTLDASWVMMGIYGVLLVVVASGFLAYAGNDATILWFRSGPEMADLAANIHQGVLPVLWILIVIHLIGVVMSVTDDRERGVFQSMITGYKNVEARPASLSIRQKWFSVISAILFLLFLLFFGYKVMGTNHQEPPSTHVNNGQNHD